MVAGNRGMLPTHSQKLSPRTIWRNLVRFFNTKKRVLDSESNFKRLILAIPSALILPHLFPSLETVKDKFNAPFLFFIRGKTFQDLEHLNIQLSYKLPTRGGEVKPWILPGRVQFMRVSPHHRTGQAELNSCHWPSVFLTDTSVMELATRYFNRLSPCLPPAGVLLEGTLLLCLSKATLWAWSVVGAQ